MSNSPLWLTPYEVLHCLTASEAIAIDSSTFSDVRLIKLDLLSATDAIDLRSAEFTAAVTLLQQRSILTAQRASQVREGVRVR